MLKFLTFQKAAGQLQLVAVVTATRTRAQKQACATGGAPMGEASRTTAAGGAPMGEACSCRRLQVEPLWVKPVAVTADIPLYSTAGWMESESREAACESLRHFSRSR